MNDGNVDSTFVLKFGEYRLVEELGESAQLRVFKARHGKLQRDVVIKLLREEFAANREALARFRREMEAVGGVEHTHVVWATDAGEHEGTPYIVMEYLAGRTLQQIVAARGPLRTADACELVRQAAEGLACIHERGMVHRDVKPSNLLLTSDGIVKLLDFGLVRMTEGSTSGEELTATASALGTADYMAPEQATDSRSVDFRADIYSLGCTLYELLTGAAPFSNNEHDTAVKKLLAHRQAPAPSVQATRRDVPDELAHLLERMLAKAPGDRPRSIADVMGALKNFTDGHALQRLVGVTEAAGAARGMRPLQPGPAPSVSEKSNRGTPITVGRPSRRLLSVGVLTLLAIPVVIYVGWRAWHATPEPAVVQNGAPSDVEAPVGSGTGDSVSTIPTGAPPPQAPRPTPTPTPEQEFAELREAVDGANSAPSLADQAELRQRVAAFARRSAGTSLQIAAAEVLARLTSPADTRQQASIPAEELAAAGRNSDQPPPEELGGRDGNVVVWNVETGELVRKMNFGAWPKVLAFHGEPEQLYVALNHGGNGTRTVGWWDVATGRRQRTLQVPGETWSLPGTVPAADGSFVVSVDEQNDISIWESGGRERVILSNHEAAVEVMAVSANGKWVASAEHNERVRIWDATSGEELRTLLTPGVHGTALAFSPDGRWLACGSSDCAVRVWDTETWEVPALLTGHELTRFGITAVAFSPNGTWIASCSGDGTVRVWDVASHKPHASITIGPARGLVNALTYFPDSRHLASGNQNGTVYLLRLKTE